MPYPISMRCQKFLSIIFCKTAVNLCGHVIAMSCRILIRILGVCWRRSEAVPSLAPRVKLWLCLAMTGKILRHILSKLTIIFEYSQWIIHAKRKYNIIIIDQENNNNNIIIIMLGVKRACSDDRYEAPHVRVQSPSIDEGMWQDIRKG